MVGKLGEFAAAEHLGLPDPSASVGLCFADDVEDGIFAWLEYVHRDDIDDDHKELLLKRAKKRQQEFWEFPV